MQGLQSVGFRNGLSVCEKKIINLQQLCVIAMLFYFYFWHFREGLIAAVLVVGTCLWKWLVAGMLYAVTESYRFSWFDSYCNRIWLGSGVEVAPDAWRCVYSRQGSDDLSVERQWS